MGSEYLTRGAMLVCNKGSHPRRLNLPVDHGTYVNQCPMIQKGDCVVETNIAYFGICNSETPPDGAETIALVKYGEESSGGTVQGLKCTPQIIGKWRSSNQMASLLQDETVTTDSFLICRCGGLIEPKTSGQEYSDGE